MMSTAPCRYHCQNLLVEPVSEELHRVRQRQLHGQPAQRPLHLPLAGNLQAALDAAGFEDGHGLEEEY